MKQQKGKLTGKVDWMGLYQVSAGLTKAFYTINRKCLKSWFVSVLYFFHDGFNFQKLTLL